MQQVQITRWGNSLGFRLPRGIADSLGVRAGDTLELTPSGEGILLRKAQQKLKRYALAEVIDSFATAAEYPEENFGPPQGEEVW